MDRRRFSQTVASVWQTAFVVSHKMPWGAMLTAVKNYNKSLEKLQDFFFKTETKTKCSRPRLHDPRPRLIFILRRLETSLEDYITDIHRLFVGYRPSLSVPRLQVYHNIRPCRLVFARCRLVISFIEFFKD